MAVVERPEKGEAGTRFGRGESGAWAGARVLVVGWARSGRAAAEALHARGARVWASDLRDPDALRREGGAEAVPSWLAGSVWGAHPVALAGEVDAIVVSPGVALDLPLVAAARDRGTPVLAEVELAWRLGRAPILGVTGTNGKSTVVTMLGDCFRAAGLSAVVAGNVGLPLVSVYPSLDAGTAAVVELSSYQLEAVDLFHARGAVILNLQPDHLGRHGSLGAYREAKARLLENQDCGDFAVLSADDPEVASLAPRVRGRSYEVSLRGEVTAGGYLADGHLWLAGMSRRAEPPRRLLAAGDLLVPGEHNVANALSAAVAAVAWGVPPAAVAQALRSFRALPHRIEPVGRVGGVLLVNDSKGTNVDSTMAALRATPAPLVLLAGGVDKGLSFLPLRGELAGRARGIVLFGEARERMSRELAGLGPVVVVETMAQGLREAVALAKGEGTVLFSPACSSFDQFRDFEDRGEKFREACRELPGYRPLPGSETLPGSGCREEGRDV